MTIIAGFPGHGVFIHPNSFHADRGYVVLAADSEEGTERHKTNVKKISEVKPLPDHLRCLISGAGDAFFIDLAVQEAAAELEKCQNLSEMRDALWRTVVKIYQERIEPIRPSAGDHETLDFQLLCAIWAKGEKAQMVYVRQGGALVRNEPMSTGGGAYLASYLIGTSHYSEITLYESTRLAAYLLKQVKRHVQYCGGNSQIAWLDDEGRCETLKESSIALHEMVFEAVVEEAWQPLLHKVDPFSQRWDLGATRETLETVVDAVVRRLGDMKKLIDRPLPNG